MNSISSVAPAGTSQPAATSSHAGNSTDIFSAALVHAPALASVNLTISPESMARIKAELAELDANKSQADSPAQAQAKASLIANRQAMLANEPTIDISSVLFTDPYTSDRALEVSALIGFVPRQDSANVAAAVHDAIASPVHQWTDTTQAVDLATQKMKLDAIVNQMIPADKQAQASAYVDKYIARQVAQRDATTLQGLEQVRALRASLGDTAAASQAAAGIAEVKAGTYRSQQDMRQALAAADALDFTSAASLAQSAATALTGLHALVQASGTNGDPYWTNQFGAYARNWQDFAASYLAH